MQGRITELTEKSVMPKTFVVIESTIWCTSISNQTTFKPKKMNNYFAAFLIVFIFSCNPSEKTESKKIPAYPDELVKVFEAHGGYSNWAKMQTLSYAKENEIHTIDLKNRKTLLSRDSTTLMGFDGTEVWVTDSAALANARFYHNLYFYFFAMPFVLADPGIIYTVVEPKKLLDKTYSGIKIAYHDGVGDSPKDNYVLYFDPVTFQMAWLMYTVTFKSQTESEKYSLIKYAEWQKVNGVQLPLKLQWHQYINDTVGNLRNEVFFQDVKLSEVKMGADFFAQPANSWIAQKPTN